MGLDMYLYAERFISEYLNKDDADKIPKVKELFPELKDFEIRNIRAEVAYWRKANAIHRWFVENVQDGNDDCGTYYVSKEKIQELLELVNEVLKNKGKASSALPTQSGFFFGSTEIDDYYFEDLKNTKEMLEKVMKLDNSLSLYYRSSW